MYGCGILMCSYQNAVLLQSILLSDSFFLEQFQRSGYDAIDRAISKVLLMNYICVMNACLLGQATGCSSVAYTCKC